MHTFTANDTHFVAFWLSILHIISETPNLISTFVLILIVIILSFINSGDMVEVCSMHVRMSISHMHMFTSNGTHFISFWLSILHISSLKLQILTAPLT